jgi:putative glutamine amidotransferase
MSRPVIGICAAVERASWGPWEERVTLLPETYSLAVRRVGAIPVLLPPDPATSEEPDRLLDRLDALLMAGGADIDAASHGAAPHPETIGTNPERDRFELALGRRALERDLPVLGICRGMQMLNIAAGGEIDQHLPDTLGHQRHRETPGVFAEHEVRLQEGSLAAAAAEAGALTVKSHHHQGVARLGEPLVATGWSKDDEVVEAIELPNRRFALGVLWHPEEDPDDRIIGAFARSASGSAPVT